MGRKGKRVPTLDWIGKQAVINHHREVPTRLLHCDSGLSAGDPEAGNLLVEGDNLEALKALLPYYAGQVKCVYIDPPFNTGSEDWIYNDNLSDPEIAAWLNRVVGPEGEDLCRHDKWLCMFYPRLKLLSLFMRRDATIFVHIDVNELDHALALCNLVFGRKNQVGLVTFKQASATGHKAINPGVVTVTNYIAMYASDKSRWKPNRLFTGRERDKRYNRFLQNPEAPCSDWKFTTLNKGYALANDISEPDARKAIKADPSLLDNFVLEMADRVAQFVNPDYDSVGDETRKIIDLSISSPKIIFKQERSGFSDIYVQNGQRIIFYSGKIKVIDGVPISGEPLTNLWDDLLSNNIHKEGGVDFPKGKKPEALIKRCLELSTKPGDLVIDSFLGSGTTAAVAHKMGRRYLGVERGEHARTHAAKRLNAVIDGESGGVSSATGWEGGGGFRYCTLGKPLFDEWGGITEGVTFPNLAAFVFFADTGNPIPAKASADVPLIGTFQGRAIYLLWAARSAGVASDAAGNVLTPERLARLPLPSDGFEGARIVYAEGCTVSPERLAAAGVAFKQIPYQVAAA